MEFKKIETVKSMKDMDACDICMEHKGYSTFGCCSIKHCLDCTFEIVLKGKCSQCRRLVTFDDIRIAYYLSGAEEKFKHS